MEKFFQMESEGKPTSEIVNKILEFFSKLSPEEKDNWKEVYKKRCNGWIERVE